MANYVVVMYLGRIMEEGPVDEIFHAPRHPYTRALLRSIPSMHSETRTVLPVIAGALPHPFNRPPGCPFHPRCEDIMPRALRDGRSGAAHVRAAARGELLPAQRCGRTGMTAPLLDVRGLRKFFPIAKGMFRRVTGHVRAVDDVSFTVQEGEALGLVGESGCGKTTTARCILRAIDPTEGQVLYRTRDDTIVDLAPMSAAELGPLRKEIQMIFQDPFGSLNPRMTLFDNVGEPLLVNGMRNRRERMDRVAELLRMVGLRPEFMHRFPHAFSGGQRQRIGIARALATGPRLVVADEPVSALDVSVQAQVLNLLLELQSQAAADVPVRRARPVGGATYLRPRRGDVCRATGRAGDHRCGVQPSAPSLYRGADARCAGARSAGVGRRCDPEGRGAEPGVSAIGLLLPSALHVRRGAVPNGGAGAAGGDAGSLRTVSLRGGVGIGSGPRHIADDGVQLCE